MQFFQAALQYKRKYKENQDFMGLSFSFSHELFSTIYPKHLNVIDWVSDCHYLAMDDNL